MLLVGPGSLLLAQVGEDLGDSLMVARVGLHVPPAALRLEDAIIGGVAIGPQVMSDPFLFEKRREQTCLDFVVQNVGLYVVSHAPMLPFQRYFFNTVHDHGDRGIIAAGG